MLKKIKEKFKKAKNRGSSFVLVIVSTTFMCVLVSALLMGMVLAYKLKFYKLNSLNNFYSVEKAMDEIYAGVGASTNEYLYSAYTTTAELVVYYDTTNSEYTNMDNDEANELFKKLFMQGIVDDGNYNTIPSLIVTLEGFITDDSVDLETDNLKIIYTDANGNEYYIKKTSNGSATGTNNTNGSFNENTIKQITFKNICVKRTIEVDGVASGKYVQSITTDLTLTEPEYNVSFDMSSSNSDSLYSYAILADMGIEIDGSSNTADVDIYGNVYAASDYYNKDYNSNSTTKVTNKYTTTPTTTWGSTDESAYSGIFVSGSNAALDLSSDVVICAGSLAAFDGASIDLSSTTSSPAELWTDNIIIGGSEGGSIQLAANAYVYDDTELNAENSYLKFYQGSYFGYSYSADDTRSIDLLKNSGYLASNYELKSHFSDSAIIVNGEGSTLDLSSLSDIYIAGKSYIEFSKVAASSLTDEEKVELGLTNGEDYEYTNLLDYSTGQSLDVKSNQLIFLTNWEVDVIYVSDSHKFDKDDNGNYLYVTGDSGTFKSGYEALPSGYDDDYTYARLNFPSSYKNAQKLLDLYNEFLSEDGSTVTAIQQEVSGHDYYYLYVDGDNAEEFVEAYYDLVAENDESISDNLYNVVNYEDFEVQIVLPESNSSVDGSKINASAAVTAQDTSGALYLESSTNTTLNVENSLNSTATSKTFSKLLGDISLADISSYADDLSGSDSWSTEEQVSNLLNYIYINMKDHFSVINKTDNSTAVETEVNAYDIVEYSKDGSTYTTDSYNYSVTPLNYFVDYETIFALGGEVSTTVPGATSSNEIIVYSPTDVEIDLTGDVKGIVISGGDVTFGDDVTSFTGLIIAGGKVIIDNSISISSDANYVAGVLQDCYDSTDTKYTVLTAESGGIIKNFESSSNSANASVTSVSISDISYGDILVFENWKKNVE